MPEISSSPGRYTRIAMVLHWAVALLIAGNLALAWTIDLFPDTMVRSAVDTHKSLGITVLGLVVLRLLWRWSHRPPPLPAAYPRWERAGAHAAHAALYALILALPVSGWVHDSAWKDAPSHPMRLFGLVPWPRLGFIIGLDPAAKESVHAWVGQLHGLLGFVIVGLVALHIAGALKHQFWDGERELQRIAS